MIVITSMDKLPEFCAECPCNNGEYTRCEADVEGRDTNGYRPHWCPLKEINELSGNSEKVIQD